MEGRYEAFGVDENTPRGVDENRAFSHLLEPVGSEQIAMSSGGSVQSHDVSAIQQLVQPDHSGIDLSEDVPQIGRIDGRLDHEEALETDTLQHHCNFAPYPAETDDPDGERGRQPQGTQAGHPPGPIAELTVGLSQSPETCKDESDRVQCHCVRAVVGYVRHPHSQ